MLMSKIRKKLQDKLRRKYHWNTNTNYNRGCNLIKKDAVRHLLHKENKWVIDFAICHDNIRIRDSLRNRNPEYEIQMWLTRSKPLDDGNWKTIEQIPIYFSFEEFELLYNILKEHREEVKGEMICQKK